jgi:DNA-binding NtrC family response regulator
MEIHTVKIIWDAGALHAAGETINPEFLQNHLKIQEVAPAAYVVSKKDLDLLIHSCEGVIEDRGEKKPAVDLARSLLGRKKIPAIDVSSKQGGYGSAKRALNGIRQLLLRAPKYGKDGGDKNIYLIGASQDLFNDIRREENGKKLLMATPPVEGSVQRINQGTETSTRLIDLLCGVTVPKELEDRFVGWAESVQLVRKLVMRVAPFRETVLILGETGTGKEIVARAIHEYSGRSPQIFKPFNCAAIPSELFESELFGSEAGVATNVGKRIGLWESAEDGSLFLDEVGELSLNHQAKILRAIHEKKIRRIGGKNEIPVNARIIAATNKNLFSLVQRKQFREDLYYRLRGLLIPTPAMREHPADIPMLAHHRWNKITQGKHERLSREVLMELSRYSWPGNVRELNSVLSGLHAFFYDASVIEVKHVRAIFAFQGQVVGTDENKQISAERKRLEYLNYLNRVYDIIRTAQMTVEPILSTPLNVDEKKLLELRISLQRRLDELDLLLQGDTHPMARPTFNGVTQLQSTLLFFFRGMKRNSTSAIEDLRVNAPLNFSTAFAALTDEIRRIKEKDYYTVS